MINKKNLDKRICDVEERATNTQTFREFIRQSESKFRLEERDLDGMKYIDVMNYLDFLDDLCCK